MRPGVDVDAGLGLRHRARAGVAGDHRRLVEPRRRLHRGRELAGELAEGQVLALLLDQPERRDVPERRGAAVAEDHLVAVGQREQLGEPLADPADHVADRRLPVRRTHQRRAGGGERVEVGGLDLGGSGPEPPVGGQQVGGDPQRVGHASYSGSRPPSTREESRCAAGAPRRPEGLQRVLLLGGVLLGLAGVGIAAWGLVVDGWGLVAGPVLVVFAVACAGRLPRRRPRAVLPGVRGPQPGGRRDLRELRVTPLAELGRELEIVRVGYGHPDAMLLIAEVQAEYVVRYGGPDDTPLDPLMFEPPLGSFYVGYLRSTAGPRPVATGAWRVHDDVEAFGTRRTAEIKRMYVVPAARARGLARAMLAHLEAGRGRGRRRGDDPRDRHRAARGDGALRVVGLHADPVVRLLQGRAAQPLLRQAAAGTSLSA